MLQRRFCVYVANVSICFLYTDVHTMVCSGIRNSNHSFVNTGPMQWLYVCFCQCKPSSAGHSTGEKHTMKDVMYKLSANLQVLMMSEEGQDLVEYALLVALVSLGAVTSLSTLATDIKSVFTAIGTRLSSSTV